MNLVKNYWWLIVLYFLFKKKGATIIWGEGEFDFPDENGDFAKQSSQPYKTTKKVLTPLEVEFIERKEDYHPPALKVVDKVRKKPKKKKVEILDIYKEDIGIISRPEFFDTVPEPYKPLKGLKSSRVTKKAVSRRRKSSKRKEYLR